MLLTLTIRSISLAFGVKFYLQDSSTATARSRVYRPWGSDPTAACGGRRQGNEWQRSARDAGDKTPRTFAGYRNRGSNAVHCDSNPQPAYAGCHFTMVGQKKMASAKAEAIF